MKYTGDGRGPVFHSVGGVDGLMIQITENGSKSWLQRLSINGKRRVMGLGSYPEISLADARDKAREARQLAREGIDPIEARKAKRAEAAAASARNLTFGQALDRYIDEKLVELASEKNRKQWERMLRSYAAPVLGPMPISDITVHDVLRVITPIWQDKNETARRVCNRIENVLDWAASHQMCAGRDLVVWRATLKNALPKVKKEVAHHPAVPIDLAPAWFADISSRETISAKALAMLCLTATRSQMLRGARWEEFDLDAAVWTLPKARTKMKRNDLRIPLAPAAIALLESLPRMGPLVFPSPHGGQLSDAALSKIMGDMDGYLDPQSGKRAKPHGLRSTFRDWAAERTSFDWASVEKSLEHLTGTDVERAYQRSDMLEKRRPLMEAWAGYLTGQPAEVIL
ncbi:integrase arm-type DNA-binding domain-containing protein [Rhodobacteraceae bacterium NNCM2]|nr:integrase arm-type DNA-binding domain-containing protein [Coraliihabitans acroporae]